MIGALNHATTAAEIALDRVMAPTQLLRDLAAGYALETCLDCPTPDLIGWTFASHLIPLKNANTAAAQVVFARSLTRRQIKTPLSTKTIVAEVLGIRGRRLGDGWLELHLGPIAPTKAVGQAALPIGCTPASEIRRSWRR